MDTTVRIIKKDEQKLITMKLKLESGEDVAAVLNILVELCETVYGMDINLMELISRG